MYSCGISMWISILVFMCLISSKINNKCLDTCNKSWGTKTDPNPWHECFWSVYSDLTNYCKRWLLGASRSHIIFGSCRESRLFWIQFKFLDKTSIQSNESGKDSHSGKKKMVEPLENFDHKIWFRKLFRATKSFVFDTNIKVLRYQHEMVLLPPLN